MILAFHDHVWLEFHKHYKIKSIIISGLFSTENWCPCLQTQSWNCEFCYTNQKLTTSKSPVEQLFCLTLGSDLKEHCKTANNNYLYIKFGWK